MSHAHVTCHMHVHTCVHRICLLSQENKNYRTHAASLLCQCQCQCQFSNLAMAVALRSPSSPSPGLTARALCGAQAAALVSDECCVRAARWLRARVLRARGLLELKPLMGGLVNSMGSSPACRLRHAAAIPPERADSFCTVAAGVGAPDVCRTCVWWVVCPCGGPAATAPRARVETWRGWRKRHRSASAWWAVVPRSRCPGCASRTASWVLRVLALAARWGRPGARAR